MLTMHPDVGKMKSYNQNKSEHGEDFAPAKPVIRTFYDHTEPINDLDFHPTAHVLASCARDNTVKFYDFSQVSPLSISRHVISYPTMHDGVRVDDVKDIDDEGETHHHRRR